MRPYRVFGEFEEDGTFLSSRSLRYWTYFVIVAGGVVGALSVDRSLTWVGGSDLAMGLFLRIPMAAFGGFVGVEIAQRLVERISAGTTYKVSREPFVITVGALLVLTLVSFLGVLPTLGLAPDTVGRAWRLTAIPYALALGGAGAFFTARSGAPEPSRGQTPSEGSDVPPSPDSGGSSNYSLEAQASMLQRELLSLTNDRGREAPRQLLEKLDHLERLADDATEQGQHSLARRINRFLDSTRGDVAGTFLDEGRKLYESSLKARKRGDLDEFRSFLERAENHVRQGLSLVNPVEAEDVHGNLSELLGIVQTLQDDAFRTRDLDQLREAVERFLDEASKALRLADQAHRESQPERARQEAERAERAAQRASNVARASLELAVEVEDTQLEQKFSRYESEAEKLERKAERASIGGKISVDGEDGGEDDVRAALKATGKVSTIEQEFASGGFGRTFLCRDELDRRVVVKTLRQEWKSNDLIRDSFRNEASLESGRHPNLVHVDAYFEKHGYPFKIMEYVEGGSLKDLLRQAGRLRPERALSIIEDVSEALAWVNDGSGGSDVVHRDIKPANILLVEDGSAKLTDFGLAKIDREDPEGSLAASGRQPGTLQYMSPEQAQGQASISPRSDMFSLGVVLYEALTGVHPFENGEDPSTGYDLKKRIFEEPAPLGHEAIPPALRDVLRRLLAKDPEDRFEDHQELVSTVRATREELADRADAPSPERFGHLSRYVEEPEQLEPEDESQVSFLISRLPAAEEDDREAVARDLESVVHNWIHGDRAGNPDRRTEYVVDEYASILRSAIDDEDPDEALLVARKLVPLLDERVPDRAREIENEVIEPLEVAVEEQDPSWVDWPRLLVVLERASGEIDRDPDAARDRAREVDRV